MLFIFGRANIIPSYELVGNFRTQERGLLLILIPVTALSSSDKNSPYLEPRGTKSEVPSLV